MSCLHDVLALTANKLAIAVEHESQKLFVNVGACLMHSCTFEENRNLPEVTLVWYVCMAFLSEGWNPETPVMLTLVT